MSERAVDRAAQGLNAALVGCGITASRTPPMHAAEGAALGLDYSYGLLDLDDPALAGQGLADVLDGAEARGMAGLNVTYPFKQAVIAHLHDLSDNARALGAVNTVVFRDGRRRGHNTDLWGFVESFRRGMAGAPLRAVLLLGAGGAGSAVAHGLLQLGTARLWLHDTDPDRAAALRDGLAACFGADRVGVAHDLPGIAAGLDGVVNATPVGMAKLPGCPFPPHLLRPDLWVVDIVYFPLETDLLRTARAAGCRVMPGAGMAVFQAVRAFELITGHAPDPARMRATFDSLGP